MKCMPELFPALLPHKDARELAIDQLHLHTANYTSEPIVAQLLDQMNWPKDDSNLLDPAAGDGSFLGVALKRLLDAQPHLPDDQVASRIEGWEFHPTAAAQARERLARILVEDGRDPARAAALASQIVRNKDFLLEGPAKGKKYSVCAGNPPYARWTRIPEILSVEYRQIVPSYAQSDLMHAFLARVADVLREDGELGWVTADRWLFAAGAASLREVVGKRFSIAHVQRLDPSSAFYRPKYRRAGSPPRVHPVSVILKQKSAGGTPLGRDPIYPGELAYAPAPSCGTLGSIARVRIAPWLGTPGVFLVSSAVAARLPSEHLVPAIDTDDIRDGKLRGYSRYAIATSPGTVPPPEILSHLQREMPRMCARGKHRTTLWLPPERFDRTQLAEPSLLVPRIARSLQPVLVPPGLLPVNHNLSIVTSGAATLSEIEDLLRSPESKRWMEHHAAPLENGYRSLTTRLLRTLPIWT